MAEFILDNVGIDLGDDDRTLAEEFLNLQDIAGLAHEFEAYSMSKKWVDQLYVALRLDCEINYFIAAQRC